MAAQPPSATVAGIDYGDLTLVRVQGGLDGVEYNNGALVLNRSGSGRADSMNTTHFTLNAIVQNHSLGTQFSSSEVAIIAPFERAIREGNNIPSGLSAGDTWIHGDAQGNVTLPGARLLVPEGMEVPAGLESAVARYARRNSSEETRANRDAAIAESFHQMNAPLIRLHGTEGTASLMWAGHDSAEQVTDLQRFAQTMLPGHEIAVGALHSNAGDGDWERRTSQLRYRMQDYSGGQRLEADDFGAEHKLFPLIQRQIQEMGTFIEERITNHADPRAVVAYQRQLNATLAEAERTVVPEHKREVAAAFGENPYYYSEGGKPVGPVSFDELAAKGVKGELSSSMIWQQGMQGWEKYEGSPEHQAISSMRLQRPTVLSSGHQHAGSTTLASATDSPNARLPEIHLNITDPANWKSDFKQEFPVRVERAAQLAQAYQQSLGEVTAHLDARIAALGKEGVTVSDADKAAAMDAIKAKPLHIGANAAAANKPLVDFIDSGLFTDGHAHAPEAPHLTAAKAAAAGIVLASTVHDSAPKKDAEHPIAAAKVAGGKMSSAIRAANAPIGLAMGAHGIYEKLGDKDSAYHQDVAAGGKRAAMAHVGIAADAANVTVGAVDSAHGIIQAVKVAQAATVAAQTTEGAAGVLAVAKTVAGRAAMPIAIVAGGAETYAAIEAKDGHRAATAVGSTVGGIAAGIGTAMAAGAAIGSIVPIAGTAVGAAVGLVAGIGGALLGGWLGGKATDTAIGEQWDKSLKEPAPQSNRSVSHVKPVSAPDISHGLNTAYQQPEYRCRK